VTVFTNVELPLRYTANDLKRALVAIIKHWVAGEECKFLSSTNPLPGEKRAYVNPSVWAGKIPSKLAGFKQNNALPPYPTVIVRPKSIVYTLRDYGVCEVDIAVACWSDDPLDGAETDTRTLLETITYGIFTNVAIPPADFDGNIQWHLPGFMLHDEHSVTQGLIDDPEEELGPVCVGLINCAFGVPCPVLNEDFELPVPGYVPPIVQDGTTDV
jgi:hypothetical protein